MDVFRGDIWYVEKGGYTGHEYGGGRPAVVVSNNKCNQFSECIEVVYLTSQKKSELPTHVDVVCQIASTALCEQVYTVSKDRLGNFFRQCTKAEMQKIDDALKISLGLDKETLSSSEKTASECAIDSRIKELEMKIKEQVITIDALETSHRRASADAIKVLTERDLYKSLYESLLEKVTK